MSEPPPPPPAERLFQAWRSIWIPGPPFSQILDPPLLILQYLDNNTKQWPDCIVCTFIIPTSQDYNYKGEFPLHLLIDFETQGL